MSVSRLTTSQDILPVPSSGALAASHFRKLPDELFFKIFEFSPDLTSNRFSRHLALKDINRTWNKLKKNTSVNFLKKLSEIEDPYKSKVNGQIISNLVFTKLQNYLNHFLTHIQRPHTFSKIKFDDFKNPTLVQKVFDYVYKNQRYVLVKTPYNKKATFIVLSVIVSSYILSIFLTFKNYLS
jgi:hypothetical protein